MPNNTKPGFQSISNGEGGCLKFPAKVSPNFDLIWKCVLPSYLSLMVRDYFHICFGLNMSPQLPLKWEWSRTRRSGWSLLPATTNKLWWLVAIHRPELFGEGCLGPAIRGCQKSQTETDLGGVPHRRNPNKKSIIIRIQGLIQATGPAFKEHSLKETNHKMVLIWLALNLLPNSA